MARIVQDRICDKCNLNDWIQKPCSGQIQCRPCKNLQAKEYAKRNKDKLKAKHERYRRSGRAKDVMLQRNYNISLEHYEQMLKAQDGKCAICLREESSRHNLSKEIKELSVDHCHTTGKVRGLLCTNCNFGIGKFEDCPELLQKAIEYLNR
jgi:hypothetical protein